MPRNPKSTEGISAQLIKQAIAVSFANYGHGMMFRRDAEDMVFWRVMTKAPKTRNDLIDAIKQAILAERVAIYIEPTLYRRFEGVRAA